MSIYFLARKGTVPLAVTIIQRCVSVRVCRKSAGASQASLGANLWAAGAFSQQVGSWAFVAWWWLQRYWLVDWLIDLIYWMIDWLVGFCSMTLVTEIFTSWLTDWLDKLIDLWAFAVWHWSQRYSLVDWLVDGVIGGFLDFWSSDDGHRDIDWLTYWLIDWLAQKDGPSWEFMLKERWSFIRVCVKRRMVFHEDVCWKRGYLSWGCVLKGGPSFLRVCVERGVIFPEGLFWKRGHLSWGFVLKEGSSFLRVCVERGAADLRFGCICTCVLLCNLQVVLDEDSWHSLLESCGPRL